MRGRIEKGVENFIGGFLVRFGCPKPDINCKYSRIYPKPKLPVDKHFAVVKP